MAKKKKRNNHKKQIDREPSGFWRAARGVLLIVFALLLLMGGFGAGGTLSTTIFGWVYSLLGLAAYMVPLACIYWAFYKFKSEEKTVPIKNLMSMLLLLLVTSVWLDVAFADKTVDGVWEGGYGGVIGSTIGGVFLNLLDKIPSAIVLFIALIVVFAWTFSIPLLEILKNMFTRRNSEPDTDLDELKTHEPGLKLNEGVPLEHHSGRPVLKAAAIKPPKDEDHSALTTASDPDWQFPPMTLLNQKIDKADAGDYKANADTIKQTLANFSIDVEMEEVNVGPRVTQFTLKPPAGVKLSKIEALDNNLALDLAAKSIRIEAPIPGKKAVGVEVPNIKSAMVRLSAVLKSKEWSEKKGALKFAVGMDISGVPVVADLYEMPHILIAGQTKAGKSVMINALLTSFLYTYSPSELKLVLVDPKHVELAPYDDIPHLLTPVIDEVEKCISALKWSVSEMERRYKALKEARKRNIMEYNDANPEDKMPFIVIVIDELSDLMGQAGRDAEALIVRVAQKARAVGIHLVLATQSPRVTVITGLIKANVPGRIAFTVAQEVESRIILDLSGAEKLLGTGDMLFKTTDMPQPKRVQGAFIDTEETQKVTDYLRMQRLPQYDDEVVSQPVQLNGKGGIVVDTSGGGDSDDEIFRDAVRVVIENRKASTSLLQRRLRIGYGRASRLIDEMEEQGIVSHADGSKPREVLVSSMDEVFGGAGGEEPLSDFEREI